MGGRFCEQEAATRTTASTPTARTGMTARRLTFVMEASSVTRRVARRQPAAQGPSHLFLVSDGSTRALFARRWPPSTHDHREPEDPRLTPALRAASLGTLEFRDAVSPLPRRERRRQQVLRPVRGSARIALSGLQRRHLS